MLRERYSSRTLRTDFLLCVFVAEPVVLIPPGLPPRIQFLRVVETRLSRATLVVEVKSHGVRQNRPQAPIAGSAPVSFPAQLTTSPHPLALILGATRSSSNVAKFLTKGFCNCPPAEMPACPYLGTTRTRSPGGFTSNCRRSFERKSDSRLAAVRVYTESIAGQHRSSTAKRGV